LTQPSLLGLSLHIITREELRAILLDKLKREGPELTAIATVNAECLALAHQDRGYRDALGRFQLRLIDGVGVALGLRLKGVKGVERLPGRQLVPLLASLCQQQGCSLLLLGSRGWVAQEAARRLATSFPGLRAGWYSPSTLAGPKMPQAMEEKLAGLLKRLRPKVVLVALGMPKQELWIDLYRPLLEEAGVLVAVGIGGALDYLVGAVPNLPIRGGRWGLEWLFRLLAQPRKRLGRQAERLPLFIVLSIAEAVKARLASLDRGRAL